VVASIIRVGSGSVASRDAKNTLVEGELGEDGVQLPGQLGRAEDAPVELREDPRVPVEAVREGVAAEESDLDLGHHPLEVAVGGLLRDQPDGLDQGQAGGDERAELPGEVHHRLALDPRLRDLELQEALALDDPDVAQFLLVERELGRLLAGRLVVAPGELPARQRGRVAVPGHVSLPPRRRSA
jgi:hypothetical protein